MIKTQKSILKFIYGTLLTFCVLIILFAGNKVYDRLFYKKTAIAKFEKHINTEVKKVNRLIESVQKIPQELAYILEFHNVNTEEIRILLKSVLFNNNELFGSAVAMEPYQYNKDSLYFAPYLYRDGDSLSFTNLTDHEYNYFNQDWYLVPKTLMRPVWSEPYFDEGGGGLLMSTYSVPFNSFDGSTEHFKGIVTVDVSIKWLSGTLNSMEKLFEGYLIVISENGTIISSPNVDWIFHETIFTLAEEKNMPVLREIGRDLQQGKSGIRSVGKFDENINWWIYYSIIPANKWGLLSIIPEDKLFHK